MNKLPDSKIHKFDEAIRLEEEAKNAKNTKKKPAPGGKNTNKNSKLASRKMSIDEEATEEQKEPEVIEFPSNRYFNELDVLFNDEEVAFRALDVVPDVNYPDPMSLKDPESYTQQIVKRNFKRKEIDSFHNISIFTP